MVSMDKKYKTRAGVPARILCNDANSKFPVVALISFGENNENVSMYTSYGRYLYDINIEHELDLIEVSPWEDYRIDEPVMVRDGSCEDWKRRYFAGVNEAGKPLAFYDGLTRWTSEEGSAAAWGECRRPTPEELV